MEQRIGMNKAGAHYGVYKSFLANVYVDNYIIHYIHISSKQKIKKNKFEIFHIGLAKTKVVLPHEIRD